MNSSNDHHDHLPDSHKDVFPVTLTLMHTLDPAVAYGFTRAFKEKVQGLHADPTKRAPDAEGYTVAQTFEEGEVALAVKPGKGFPADLYLMDFFDTRTREMCSRMHKHTGQRFVLIFTGPDTVVKTSSLSEMEIRGTDQKAIIESLPGEDQKIHTFEVPPNSVVAIQIPTGTSHRFNAVGPNALILSTHIEEMAELDREGLPKPSMTRQTIFLADVHPSLVECGVQQDAAKKISSTLEQFLLKENATGYVSAIQAATTLREQGISADPRTLHSIMGEMELDGNPNVKRVTTIGSASTVLIKASALDALREKYETKEAARARG